METRVLPADEQSVALAGKLLRAGEVVGIPTETVYGLAANALDGRAVSRIFEAKARPGDNPLIAHIADRAMLDIVAREVPVAAKKLASAFWPGPLTMVLPRTGKVAPEVSAGLDTVGVRMPRHPAALAIIREAGVPLAAPSANRSGSPSPTTAAHVQADMEGRIPLIIDGGHADVGLESTVISLVEGRPLVLRPGFITPVQLEQVLGCPVTVAGAVTAPLVEGEHPASPGMKYKHYAPKAALTILEGTLDEFAAYLQSNQGEGVFALCFEGEPASLPVPAVVYGREGDDASQAAALFDALRSLDERDAKIVYARSPTADGVGLAVYNRLLRAAAFRVVRL